MTNDDSFQASTNFEGERSEQGMVCFEVAGLEQDCDLIRQLAQRLSVQDAFAASLRIVLNAKISGDCTNKGGILAALRNSPLVGAEWDIDLIRPVTSGRKVEL